MIEHDEVARKVLAGHKFRDDYSLLKVVSHMVLLVHSEEIFLILNEAVDKARNRMNEIGKEMRPDA